MNEEPRNEQWPSVCYCLLAPFTGPRHACVSERTVFIRQIGKHEAHPTLIWDHNVLVTDAFLSWTLQSGDEITHPALTSTSFGAGSGPNQICPRQGRRGRGVGQTNMVGPGDGRWQNRQVVES